MSHPLQLELANVLALGCYDKGEIIDEMNAFHGESDKTNRKNELFQTVVSCVFQRSLTRI